MIRNNLAHSRSAREPKQHSSYRYSSSESYRRLNVQLNRRPHSRTRRLPLSNYERKLITVSSLVIIVLMMTLISSKLSNGVDQQRCQTLTTRISRLRGQNSSLQQRISNLQNNHRLSKIAHRDKLGSVNKKNLKNVR